MPHILSKDVVGCVLILSKTAFEHSTFEEVVSICSQAVSMRREFRLFVCPYRMSKEELLQSAQKIRAVAELMDSVYITLNPNINPVDELISSLNAHSKAIYDILDYVEYEKWKSAGFRFSEIVNKLFGLAMLVPLGYLGLSEQALNSQWLPWILLIVGTVFFFSSLAILSLGSTLQTGRAMRFVVASYPLYIISIVPAPKLVENWSYMLAGFCLGFLLDTSRRAWAQYRRQIEPIVVSEDPIQQEFLLQQKLWRLPGHRYWQFLTTTPRIGMPPRVFISYARSSRWGLEVASELYKELEKVGIPSFLDVEKLQVGSSWRHKLGDALGTATILISVQDSITMPRNWPTAELASASVSQAYCGVPTIIVLRNEELLHEYRLNIFLRNLNEPFSLLLARGRRILA